MICNGESVFPGLLFLVSKMSHFILRKIRHVTADVMSASHKPVSHKCLSEALSLGMAPRQCPPVRSLRNGDCLPRGTLRHSTSLRWD